MSKLRRGHLRGNHFTLRVEGIASDAATRLPDLLDVLSGGVPNYYGPQRFGYGDDGVQRALEALQRRGKKGAQTFRSASSKPRFLTCGWAPGFKTGIFTKWSVGMF